MGCAKSKGDKPGGKRSESSNASAVPQTEYASFNYKFPNQGQVQATPSIPVAVKLRDINEDYKIGKQLGTGHFGSVRIAKYAASGTNSTQHFAIKTLEKAKIESAGELEQLKREIEIMLTLDHPNIVKLYEVYEDAKYLHLVMEKCDGGELFDRIFAAGHFSEAKAAGLFKQVLQAVSFIHQNGIAHRDLKPENFLFESKEENSELKLCDFGLSNKFSNKRGQVQKMQTMVGSPFYVAPEVLSNQAYGHECDIWSAGVILYILLSGKFPFDGEGRHEIFRAVMNGYVDTTQGVWRLISSHAKDLIRSMIQKVPTLRLTADQALQHKWFDQNLETEIQIDPEIINSLRQYKAKSKMQKEAMNVLVKYLEIKELGDLRQIFKELDITCTGTLTAEEIENALTRVGIQAAHDEIHEIIANIDYLGNGEINYSEFLAATFQSKFKITEQHLWTVFKRFDTDNSGYITKENLQEVMSNAGKTVTPQEIEGMIQEVDSSKDGRISFQEFEQLMHPEKAGIINSLS